MDFPKDEREKSQSIPFPIVANVLVVVAGAAAVDRCGHEAIAGAGTRHRSICSPVNVDTAWKLLLSWEVWPGCVRRHN